MWKGRTRDALLLFGWLRKKKGCKDRIILGDFSNRVLTKTRKSTPANQEGLKKMQGKKNRGRKIH